MNYDVLVSTKDLSRPDWLRWRQKGLGGSDIAGILGESDYSSPMKVYLDKTTPISDDAEGGSGEAMRQGRDLEEYCAKRFEEETGKSVYRVNAIIKHKQHPFIIANLDRRVANEDSILECKTTNAYNEKQYAAGVIPPQYLWQCHHYLLATGATKCYLAVLVLGRDFHVFEIQRDDALLASLLEEEKKFWSLVEAGTPPAQVG